MKLLIAGATGFVGQALTRHYLARNFQITALGRSEIKIKKLFGQQVKSISWSQINPETIKNFDYIINLAGASIGARRWSPTYKKILLQSRLKTATILAETCTKLAKNSPALFNASAVSIYGVFSPSEQLPDAFDEDSPINFDEYPNFLSEIARKWEAATEIAKKNNVRVINLRFGVILGNGSAALNKLKLPFLLGLGGPIGGGTQAFAWISLLDLVHAIDFLISHTEIKGPVNLVSPVCIQQIQLAKAIANTLNRPCYFNTPAIFLKLLLGEMADELLLKGQCVKPKILIDHGFVFQHSDIESAIKYAFSEKPAK